MKRIFYSEPKSKLRKVVVSVLRIVGGLVFVYAAFMALTSYDLPAEDLNHRLKISQRTTSLSDSTKNAPEVKRKHYQAYCLNGVVYFSGSTTWHPNFDDDGRVMLCRDYGDKLDSISLIEAFDLGKARNFRFRCVDNKLYVRDKIFKNSVMVPIFDAETRAITRCNMSDQAIGDIIDLRKN
ncbi:hypothetical protein LCS82_09140 [Vibrio harveyi]|uniref:hypothetical protein n=1 Tax=Vibrio harveyi TaxID=669 RepID=UPI003BB48BE7